MNSRGTASLLKDSISFTDVSASGLFEGHDLLRRGFTSVKNELLPSHPLELTEKNISSHKWVDVLILIVFCHGGGVQILKLEFQLNQDKTNFARLRNIQGIHAPLKLQMEFRAVKQVQRLPFLHSSNMAMDILRGNDECIGFEDILNDPSQSEVMGEPHMMMEHKLGLFIFKGLQLRHCQWCPATYVLDRHNITVELARFDVSFRVPEEVCTEEEKVKASL